METFPGTVAVVTGSCLGIGKAIAKALAKKGLTVVGLSKDVSEGISENTKIHELLCDLRNEKEIQKAFQLIKANYGPVSILVNSAGRLDDYIAPTAEKFDDLFDMNVRGLLLCSEEAMSAMKSNGTKGGHIVNIISLPFVKAITKHMRYFSSKYALRSLSDTMRHAICEEKLHIKVTDISPGLADTPMVNESMSKYMAAADKEMADKGKEMIILPPEEVANACIFVLNTPANVLISELTIMPIHEMTL